MNFSKYILRMSLLTLCMICFLGCDRTSGATTVPAETQPTAVVSDIPVVAPDEEGATPEPDMDPAVMDADQRAQTAALMKVARTLSKHHGADPVAVTEFCNQNRDSFANVTEVQACKKLAGSKAIAKAPTARSKQEAFRIASTMELTDRFLYCTSDNVMGMIESGEDYDLCFPPASQQALEAAGGVAIISDQRSDEPVSFLAQREQILLNATHMNERERQVYCRVPEVLRILEGQNQGCLVGLSPINPGEFKTDMDEGYTDSGH